MSYSTALQYKASAQKNDVLRSPLDRQLSSIYEHYLKMDVRLKSLESAYKKPHVFQDMKNSPKGLFQKSASQHQNNQKEKTMLNDFLRFGLDHQSSRAVSSRYGSFQKSLTSHNAKDNAILLPSPTQDFVERVMPDYSPLRKIARVTHIATDSLELLMDKGGGDVGWATEMSAREETESPELTKLIIPTHELFARPRASQKLLDDASVNLENWLAQKIAWQMGLFETEAFVKGDGKGKPRGFLSYPTTALGKPEWGKIEVAHMESENILDNSDILLDVFHSLKPEYLQGASWVMSRATLALVRKLKDKDGNYMWLPHLNQEVASTLLGYPVLLCDAMPSPEKDSLSIAFGNFQHGYQIVERQDIQVLRDPYSAKPYVEFYATKRVGGDVAQFDALKLIKF